MELNRAVAENIKRIRKSKKLSMEKLAAEAGVSRSMLGQIERGEANPSVAIIGKLATALKVPAELLLENDSFEPLAEYPEVKTKPKRFDAGKVVLRENFSYDEVTRLESYFLDLYISGKYEPELSVPGCVCYATVMSGTAILMAEDQTFRMLERDAILMAEDQTFRMLERDAIRFAADRPYRFENMTNASARVLLLYQYLK